MSLQACGTYSCSRQTRRWPMCLFYNMINISCYNAYVCSPLWTQAGTAPRASGGVFFLEQVGRGLIAPAMAKRRRLPRGPSAASLVLQAREQVHDQEEEQEEEETQPGPSRKRNQWVLSPKRKRVWNQCTKCGAHACKIHLKVICGVCVDM